MKALGIEIDLKAYNLSLVKTQKEPADAGDTSQGVREVQQS
jgi:hypothetical protein